MVDFYFPVSTIRDLPHPSRNKRINIVCKHVRGVIEFSDLEGMFQASSIFKGLTEDSSQLTFCIIHLTFELLQIVFILLQERYL